MAEADRSLLKAPPPAEVAAEKPSKVAMAAAPRPKMKFGVKALKRA